MDIKELTNILKRCCETESMDELVKAAGMEDEGEEGDSISIKMCFGKDHDVTLKGRVVKKNTRISEMTLEELQDYLIELEDRCDGLYDREPEDEESAEHEEWDDRITDLENLMDEIRVKIDKLENVEE